jgi:hypothetical protein
MNTKSFKKSWNENEDNHNFYGNITNSFLMCALDMIVFFFKW